jgi:DNA-binding response OmpR family regulator
MRMRVLLVEDDDGVASALVEALGEHGHHPTRCRRGEDALILHREEDVVLLDLGLPGIDGFEVLHKLRRVSVVPVLVLTADGDERSVVRALHCGADDYVVKPIRLRELLARIAAVTRRSAARGSSGPCVVQVADVLIDLDARTVLVAGKPVVLTAKEFEVLAVLARHPGTAVSRHQIMDVVWGDAYLAVSRSLDVHMAAVRAKLGRPELLQKLRHGVQEAWRIWQTSPYRYSQLTQRLPALIYRY